MIFWARSELGEDGKPKLSLGSEYNRARFADHLRKNVGGRYKIEPELPESRKQRKFFEGAVIPLLVFYQEGLDYKNTTDLAKVRDWLKLEFNAEFVTIAGKSRLVPKSSKGELNKGLLERIMDWMGEQGYQTELLNAEEYKKWRDTVRPFEGPENYIDYLLECGKLKRK